MKRFLLKNTFLGAWFAAPEKGSGAEKFHLRGTREWIPVFCGVLFSMILCALAAARGPLSSAFVVRQVPAAPPPADEIPVRRTEPEDTHKTVLEYYRDPLVRGEVIGYFADLCGSREVASVILINAEVLDIPAALAFSLCWEESRYNPRAVNRANRDGSVDRGLFQLNNRSFPKVDEKDFFNPGINTYYGMRHLRWCLDSGGSVITALAMYNAGTGRVRSLGAPKNTLDYIHRILERQEKIEARFRQEFRDFDARVAAGKEGSPEGYSAEIAGLPQGRPEKFRFIPLMPLTGIR
ncbi:MAG: lytic transglycosylase domain-containing protein [Treponema sp.]|nr:lytic transglycosylase domain-containing protein [Treponema sp.]